MLIKQISAKETYPLRIEILRKGIAKNYQFKEDTHASSIHLGAYKGDQCIGILTLVKKKLSQASTINSYQLRGMAINKDFQRQGIGKKLVLEAFSLLQDKIVEVAWCNARINAVDFYKKIGFKSIGEAFDIPSIGIHYQMMKEIYIIDLLN